MGTQGDGDGEDGLKTFHIYAVGERDAMSVNMRNAGLESLNEKYMTHLRNTMRREVSLISMDQRSLLNRFNTYSMTMVGDSMAPSTKDRRTYLQFLKERQQQNQAEDAFGSPDPLSRSRTFIESQRTATADATSASLSRLRLLTRPSRQSSICPRLAAAPVARVHPEFAPSLDRSNRARTAPTPQTLLRMHYQRLEQQDTEDPELQQQQQQQRIRRVHSTLGFSVHDARLRRRALNDGRFLRLRETLQKVPPPVTTAEQLRQEDL